MATSSRHDAGQRAARDDDVVERDVAVASSIGWPPRRIRPSSAIRSSIANSPATMLAEHGLELARLGLREEADLAEVDAEDRHVDLGHGPGRAQERAVAAEHDERVGRRQLARAGASRSPACGCPVVDAAHLAPAGGALAAARRRPRSSGCRRSRCAVDRHAAGRPSAIRSPISAQPGPGARWTRNSRLPSGPRIGEAMTSRVPEPERRARRRRPARGPRGGPPGRGRRRGPSAPAGLELRLDQGDDVAAAGASVAATGPRTSASEMNETSIAARLDRLGQASSAVSVAGVRPLHRDDPRVARGATRPAGRDPRRAA